MTGTVDIPDELLAGEWIAVDPDPEWIWTVECKGEVVGFLAAMGAHGIAFILRVKILPNVPNECLMRLLRKFLGDMEQRGYRVYMTWLTMNPVEAGLARMIIRAGGQSMGIKHVMVGGLVDQAARF
jgi:hypothetical protein